VRAGVLFSWDRELFAQASGPFLSLDGFHLGLGGRVRRKFLWNFINPDDIESIDVLRMLRNVYYGSRGANWCYYHYNRTGSGVFQKYLFSNVVYQRLHVKLDVFAL